ncbi:hypothetical protein [Streptomyces alfalfae]|uniref:Uncharacterized protein n=1 Tax=Streptomyces alfalfae TaxID=1642299 RepID=A0A7T4PGJ0_9ACTN|nr:hypothetical protein [Streptomyces alfalfae]QQC89857.1 hypothetical protein I8755_16620 [Streptomyces alfalfae]
MKRYTASTITDDALDALYENANEGWRRGDRWKKRARAAEEEYQHLLAELSGRYDALQQAEARADQAEAAIARLSAYCDELDEHSRVVLKNETAQHPVAANIRHRLTDPKESATP